MQPSSTFLLRSIVPLYLSKSAYTRFSVHTGHIGDVIKDLSFPYLVGTYVLIFVSLKYVLFCVHIHDVDTVTEIWDIRWDYGSNVCGL